MTKTHAGILFLKKLLGQRTYMQWRNLWLFGENDDPVMLQSMSPINLNWPLPAIDQSGPVFLISPTQRSGSTFMHNLLALHPDLEALSDLPGMPQEFFLHSYAAALKAYTEKTMATWENWVEDPAQRQEKGQHLIKSIGSGIMNGLYSGEGRILLRAPDAHGIDHIFHLFSTATVIMLVRDGRDTVASFHNSWGSDSVFSLFCTRWAARVSEMLAFQEKATREGYDRQVILIKYEDFLTELQAPLNALMTRLDLSIEKFPLDQARELPIFGSSTEESVHWNPVVKTSQFNPTGRWHDWSARQQKTFSKIAGDMNKKLGYT